MSRALLFLALSSSALVACAPEAPEASLDSAAAAVEVQASPTALGDFGCYDDCDEAHYQCVYDCNETYDALTERSAWLQCNRTCNIRWVTCESRCDSPQ